MAETSSSSGKRILILRSSLGPKPKLSISGSHEYWLKNETGIYRLAMGPLWMLPKSDIIRGAVREWRIQLGDREFFGSVSSRLDTLVLEAVGEGDAPSPRTFVRYYELEVPAWTREPQPVPRVRVIPKVARMGQDTLDVLPEPIEQALPVYPSLALRAGITGEVQADVFLGNDGTVANVEIRKGVTGLNEAAVDAVKQWKFKPGAVAGKPVPAWITLAFFFEMP